MGSVGADTTAVGASGKKVQSQQHQVVQQCPLSSECGTPNEAVMIPMGPGMTTPRDRVHAPKGEGRRVERGGWRAEGGGWRVEGGGWRLGGGG